MIPNKMNYYPLTEKRAEILDLKNFKTKLLTVHLISPEPWKVLCFHFQYRIDILLSSNTSHGMFLYLDKAMPYKCFKNPKILDQI